MEGGRKRERARGPEGKRSGKRKRGRDTQRKQAKEREVERRREKQRDRARKRKRKRRRGREKERRRACDRLLVAREIENVVPKPAPSIGALLPVPLGARDISLCTDRQVPAAFFKKIDASHW